MLMKGVLIDGGASHNVYYSAEIPKGAVERDVELAHGSKTGYIIDGDIIFLDNSMTIRPKNLGIFNLFRS